jgi:uncharacterized protein YjaG (DUF416 family)
MANINVRKRLEKLAEEIEAVAHHVKLYGGISAKDSKAVTNGLHTISNACDEIAKEATKAK